MNCIAIFEKLVLKGDVTGSAWNKTYTNADGGGWVSTVYRCSLSSAPCLPAGRYTVTADVSEGVTCRVYKYKNNNHYAGYVPADAPAELPFTFELAESCRVCVQFSFSWDGYTETITAGTDVGNIRIHAEGGSTTDVYDMRVLMPDEISENSILTQAENSKSNVNFTIYPEFETWDFCEHTKTYVRIIENGSGTIFRGRVSGVAAAVDESGQPTQEITCVSAADFLEDTPQAYYLPSSRSLMQLIPQIIGDHNSRVDDRRKLGYGAVPWVTSECKNAGQSSHFEALAALMDSDDIWDYGSNPAKRVKLCFRESYENGGSIINVLDRTAGRRSDTAIRLGDNLRNIRAERSVTSGVVTGVTVISGLSVEGYTYQRSAVDEDALAEYGLHEIVIRDESIYSREPRMIMRWDDRLQAWEYVESDSYQAMIAALEARAKLELDKYREPYIKITLSALDLAAAGFTGYERFEVGTIYPVICPAINVYEDMRVTSVRRSIARGEVVEITIEKGEKPRGTGSFSALMARLKEANDRADEAARETDEMIDAKLLEALGGIVMKKMTKEQYDAMEQHEADTIYVVDNDGEIELYDGDVHIISGGGGGTRYIIQNAVVNTSGEWTLTRDPLPVWFRGSTGAYYSGPPGRCVVQGQRALFGDVTPVPADVMSEITKTFDDSTVKKQRFLIAGLVKTSDGIQINAGAAVYSVGSGGQETLISKNIYFGAWTVPASGVSIQLGFVMRVNSISGISWESDNAQPRPNISVYGVCLVDGVQHGREWQFDLSNGISGSFPWSEAEEHFGTALLVKTEPSGGAGS